MKLDGLVLLYGVKPKSDEEAAVLSRLLEPTYANPCESDERWSSFEMVDEAVESNPLTES